jgi:hypothetical protein
MSVRPYYISFATAVLQNCNKVTINRDYGYKRFTWQQIAG